MIEMIEVVFKIMAMLRLDIIFTIVFAWCLFKMATKFLKEVHNKEIVAANKKVEAADKKIEIVNSEMKFLKELHKTELNTASSKNLVTKMKERQFVQAGGFLRYIK